MTTLTLSMRRRQVAAVAGVTLLEGARKQVFHVLMLFAISLIAVSTLLGVFDHNVEMKLVTDLCLVAIMVSSGVIAITLAVSGLPGEIEQKTVYPVIAHPLARWQFVLGKYLGVVGTVAVGMALQAVALCAILLAFTHHVAPGVLLVLPYLLLESAILAAVAAALSTVAAPPLAWFLSLVVYLVGNVKFHLLGLLREHTHTALGDWALTAMAQIVPNLECFDFKDSLVHGIPVSAAYLAQTAVYGVAYAAFLLTLASLSFNRREL